MILEDVLGVTWLAYNDPSWIAERHGLGVEAGQAVHAMSSALADLAATAAKTP